MYGHTALHFLCIFNFCNLASARYVKVDQESCDEQGNGITSIDFQHAVLEALAMAENAVTLMKGAAANLDSPQSRRIALITRRLLACDPGAAQCNKAAEHFSNVASLVPANTLGDDTLYVYCDEDVLLSQISDRGNSYLRSSVSTYDRHCDGSDFLALFSSPNLVLFCGDMWQRTGTDEIRDITFANFRNNNLNGKQLDQLRTLSFLMLHEFMHASSPISTAVQPYAGEYAKIEGEESIQSSFFDLKHGCRRLCTMSSRDD